MGAMSSAFRRVLGWRAPGRVNCVLHGAVVVGVGLVIYLGTNLILLARVQEPTGERVHLPPGGGGTLLIGGGGPTPEEVNERFLELAGGRRARVVVIPTAADWADNPGVEHAAESWTRRGAISGQVLHTHNRRVADDPAFVRPLTEATGVWICGGFQSRLSDAYAGTAVERELKALLARGGVVGGTSAGAGIMSRLMIVKGRDVAELGRGFDLFPDVVIDQHFLKRNRFRRLLGVVADHPNLVGLGVDESTAVEVDLRLQHLRVIGRSYAVACVPVSDAWDDLPHVEILKPGDEANLAQIRARALNAVATSIDVDGL